MPTFALPLLIFVGVALATVFVSSRRAAFRRPLTDADGMFAAFMEHGPFIAFMKDADGRYVYENRALVEYIGRVRPGAVTCLGRTDRELFSPTEETVYVDNDRQVIERGVPMRFSEHSVDADGTVRDWSTVKFPRIDAEGRTCVAGISIDVTELRLAKSDARANADQVTLAVEAGRMGTLTLDLATGMLETSPVFALLHGRPETRTQLTLAESLAEVHPEDRSKIQEAVQAALKDRALNASNTASFFRTDRVGGSNS
jgi:PAS domain S-box-containing protein